jgi:hypothetical protein
MPRNHAAESHHPIAASKHPACVSPHETQVDNFFLKIGMRPDNATGIKLPSLSGVTESIREVNLNC